MPRAYRPRLSTVARASVVARALGAEAWHLYRPGSFRSGPITIALVMPDGTYARITLAEAEAMIEKEPIQ